MNRNSPWIAVFALSLPGASASAHHNAAVAYDLSSEIIHENVPVVEWRFTNPHAQLVFEAPNADGVVTKWSASSGNVQGLRRNGYTPQTFQPGQIVTLRGAPGRNGQPIMELEEVVLADGSVIHLSDPAPAGLEANSPDSYAATVAESPLTGMWQFVRGPVPESFSALAPDNAYFLTVFGQRDELAPGESGDVPISEQGKAFQLNWDPSDYECIPPSGWMAFTSPYLVEIEAPRSGRLRITHEYMDLQRTVWLDGRRFPSVERMPRTLAGYSIGHWEDDTLVVETRNMHANLITRNGIYHTENAVMRERISRDGDTLVVVRVLEDPEHFTQPVASVVQKQLVDVTEIVPFGDCVAQAE